MYYRRKVLLGLLESQSGPVTKTAMQKLLFLVSCEQESASYHFVPYKFGCFSFQAEADKRTLTKYGYLADSETWKLGKSTNCLKALNDTDRKAIATVLHTTRRMTGKSLIRFVYENHPYFAINSEIAEDVLTPEHLDSVRKARPTGKPAKLFTVGYEGRSLEQYLNVLIEQNVRVLCDVRRNPVSMKFGFSKRQLALAVNGLGMLYVHMPELGIASSKRRELNSYDDYKQLFDEYERKTLVVNDKALGAIQDLVRKHRRVALTCFEADPNCCHRGRIAKALLNIDGWRHRVSHL